MPIREFKCPNGHVTEKFVPQESKTSKITCPKCKVNKNGVIPAEQVEFSTPARRDPRYGLM